MRNEREFRALLVLLSDEEERVAAAAWQALLDSRTASLPYLEEASRVADARLRGRARLLLEELRQSSAEERWAKLATAPDSDVDLQQGWLLLSHLGGQVNEQAAGSFLDAIAGMVRAQMASVGGLKAMGEVLFDNLGFRGGQYENPQSHYLTDVLEKRTGVPIALASVYLLIGRRVGLPVSGVSMPGHYLARYERAEGPIFIDCHNRGHLYQYETLADLLNTRGPGFSQRYLAPCTDRFTLFRMLNNLERVYTELDDSRMVERVRRWREYLGLESED